MLEDKKVLAKKTAIRFLEFSILCIVFAVIYETFSHQVYSGYMIGAFLFPLVGGFIPMVAFYKLKGVFFPNVFARYMYYSGIATLTVGSIFQGILDIYGTTNSLMVVYWCVGIGFVALGIGVWIINICKGFAKK